jgi:hypothetical protein
MASYKHYDAGSGDWYDINPQLGVTDEEIKRQIEQQKLERELANPPSAGSILSQGMETARNWAGGIGKTIDETFQSALEPAPDLIKRGVNASLAAPGMLARGIIEAPGVAVNAAKNLFAKPGVDEQGVPRPWEDPMKAAARPVMEDIASRGGAENIGRAVPDLAAMFTPAAGPLYGIPALEEAKKSFDEGDMWGSAGNLAMAGLVGVGGIAAAAPFAKGPKFAGREVRPPVPENLYTQAAKLEEALARGDGGEAAIAKLHDLEARMAETVRASEGSNWAEELKKLQAEELGILPEEPGYNPNAAAPEPRTATPNEIAYNERLGKLNEELADIKGDVAPVNNRPEFAGMEDSSGRYYGSTAPDSTWTQDPHAIALDARTPREFAEHVFDNAVHEGGHASETWHGEVLRETVDELHMGEPYYMSGETKVYIPEEAARGGSVGGQSRSAAGNADDFSFETKRDATWNDPRTQAAREKFIADMEAHPEIYDEFVEGRGSSRDLEKLLASDTEYMRGDSWQKRSGITPPDQFASEAAWREHNRNLGIADADMDAMLNKQSDLSVEDLKKSQPISKGERGMQTRDLLPDEVKPDLSLKDQLDAAWAESEAKAAEAPEQPLPMAAEAPDTTVPTWKEFIESPENKGKNTKTLSKEYKAKVEGKQLELEMGGPGLPGAGEKKVKTPKVEKILPSLSKWDIAAHSNQRNIAKVSPEAGTLVRQYIDDRNLLTGDWISSTERVLKGLDDRQARDVMGLLDGTVDYAKADPKSVEVARTLRTKLETVFNLTEQYGLTEREPLTIPDPTTGKEVPNPEAGRNMSHREDYFPHIFDKEAAAHTINADLNIPKDKGVPGQRENPNLKPREVGRRDYLKETQIALNRYYTKMAKTISEAKNFGPDNRLLKKTLGKAKPDTRRYIETALRQITGKVEDTLGKRVAGTTQYITALGHLGLAGISQLGQAAQTVAYAGFRNSGKAMFQLLGEMAKNKGQLKGTQSFFRAMESGALQPEIALELGASKGKFMWGIPTMDRAMRVHSFKAGEYLLEQARAGSKDAARTIKDLGFDHTNKNLSAGEIGRQISDTTQFRTGPAEKPQWANSSMGSLAYQLMHFQYRQGAFVADVSKNAGKWVTTRGQAGSPKPLIRLLVSGAIAGEVINDLKEALRGQPIDPKESKTKWNEKKWEENFMAAMKNRRIPTSRPGWRLLQNGVGGMGLGVPQALLDRALTSRKATDWMGPAIGDAADLYEGVAGAAHSKKHKGRRVGRAVGRWAVRHVPARGNQLADKFFPRESSSSGTGF